ncbi:hypothetical protein QBC41DRAFT_390058 [Cercophora samala]|uniref:SET domain-containing protein n=1 Tax=Cercophora samala TaxID=330535 RepID=A0AA39ZFX8_9PEZI|nr:hypothetical protein QBC41DRAFT_390058 [Cercophora samala]
MRAIHLLSLASCATAIVPIPQVSWADACIGKPRPDIIDENIDHHIREKVCPHLTGHEGRRGYEAKRHFDEAARMVHFSSVLFEPPLPPPFALSPPPPEWESTDQCVGQYCVFHNREFAYGRGMVAITTARNIQRLQALQKKSPPVLEPYVDRRLPENRFRPYEEATIPGKGLGYVAHEKLSPGHTVMSVYPALLVHRTFFDEVAPSAQAPLLSAAVDLLPDLLRRAFREQMAHFSGEQIHSIIQTNSFQMDLGTKAPEGGHHYGNWPEVSRFNHDCRPNVVFRINPKTLQHVTTVVREVRPGEELTISYLDQMDATENRKLRAFRAWGFDCSCGVCSGTKKQIKKSDKNLEEIKVIEGRLSGFTDRVDKKLLERLVKLYKEERLESKMAGGLTLVALNYNMLGDAKNAVKYAKLAEQAVLREFGEGNGDVKAMRELGADPRGHFTWRARVGGTR